MKFFIFMMLSVVFTSVSLEARELDTVANIIKREFGVNNKIELVKRQISLEMMQDYSETTNVDWDPFLDSEFIFHKIENETQNVSILAEHEVVGKHGNIRFAVIINQEFKIQEVIVLEYSEIRGRPIAKRRFLKQFDDKSHESHLRLGKDIQGITGATISSKGITQGVKKVMHVYHECFITESVA